MEAQKALFQSIKNLYKKETFSLVDEVSELLHLEKGATYKRLSGDTALKIDEVVALCLHYNLSFDAILEENAGLNQISFVTEHISRTSGNLLDFLMAFGHTFDSLRRGMENELIILGNELPFPYFFEFPRLVVFLYNMWHYEVGGYVALSYHMKDIHLSSEEKRIMAYLSHEFCNHPSTEIWGMRILDPVFNKLRLGIRIGMIDPVLAKDLLSDLEKLIFHLKAMAEAGVKSDASHSKTFGPVNLLINHYYQGGTFLYYNTDGYEKAFYSSEYPDFNHTNDGRYASYVKEKLMSYKAFSVSITRDNALERNLFFKHILHEFERLSKEIESKS